MTRRIAVPDSGQIKNGSKERPVNPAEVSIMPAWDERDRYARQLAKKILKIVDGDCGRVDTKTVERNYAILTACIDALDHLQSRLDRAEQLQVEMLNTFTGPIWVADKEVVR